MSQVKNKPQVILIHSRPEPVKAFFKKSLVGQCSVTATSVVTIKPLDHTIPKADFYLITSANIIDHLPDDFSKPIIAVGRQTREALDNNGLVYLDKQYDVISDLSDDYDMYKNKSIVHLSGKHRSPDVEALSNIWNVKHVIVYEALIKNDLPAEIGHALADQNPCIFIFFSARGAIGFTTLVDCAKLKHKKELTHAICISSRVFDSLNHDFFASIDVATKPDRDAILNLIDKKWNRIKIDHEK